MAFDEAKFRAEAKAAGYSDKEIDAELKGPAPAGAVPPSAISSGPDTAAKFQAEADTKRAAIVQGYEESSKKDASQSPMTMEGVLTSTPALVTGAALLGALTTYAAPKVYKGIKERYMTQAPEINRNIDIPTGGFFDVPPNPNINPVNQPEAQAVDKLRKAEELAEANRQLGIGGNQPVAPVGAVPPAPVAPAAPAFNPQAPIATPLSAAPMDAPAPTPTAGPGSPVTTIVTDTVKEMIQETPAQPMAQQPVAPPQELRTGTGKPAFAGMGPAAALNKKGQPKLLPEYADINAVPRDMAFVPGAQYIDPGRQDMGQPLFTKTYMAQDYPSTDEMARQQASEINRMLNKPTRAELKAAGLEPAPNTPGITKKTSAGTKSVRVAGTLGALMAIPDLAKAETPGQRGAALTNLLEAILPPGFTMSGAGEGSDMPPRAVDPRMANINMTNASMFAPTANDLFAGNPYAQSELAKRRRQEAEYTRKVGAGRGIAPPSAYPR
jgi:hypothetical protein